MMLRTWGSCGWRPPAGGRHWSQYFYLPLLSQAEGCPVFPTHSLQVPDFPVPCNILYDKMVCVGCEGGLPSPVLC
jgi:hypothetical protein